ncbi:hypothetical protein J437_LFUL018519 [Ladona fulva]|uniref:Alpha-1,6-mannosyl-glycoprotein 2-beta-N-acetylglucosaminyltransferase n=1 Tax=Ladona fulva TaxID=123851 RepID=A0A8K0KNV5_LADFU|nr:hypothetical protein J437_LFUL018519 [Ladona fulva]
MGEGGPRMLPRRKAASCRRTAIFLVLVTFLWLQLHVPSPSSSNGSSSGATRSASQSSYGSSSSAGGALDANDAQAAAVLDMVPQVLHKFLLLRPGEGVAEAKGPLHGNGTAGNGTGEAGEDSPVATEPALNVSEIIRRIERHNDLQVVYNEETFGPVLNDTLIIVIQVKSSFNFKEGKICSKIMFSFYRALIKGCNNAPYPDLYGHYREAKFTQTKHHWWWKANRVFDQLEVTRNHTGLVLFLEEDHYVTEDFIHVLRLMERTRKASCEQCNILSLGTYLKTYNYYGDAKRAEVTPWVSSKHNMGMAFDRSTWAEIRRCAEFFCTYDDYNWDWSLQHISQPPQQGVKQNGAGGGCLGPSHRLIAMVMKGPRVFHIGEWALDVSGVHHKKNNCEPTAVIQKVQQVVKQASKHFFPSHLTLIFTGGASGGGNNNAKNGKQQKPRKGNGGWGDRRDHQLCINMTRVGR